VRSDRVFSPDFGIASSGSTVAGVASHAWWAFGGRPTLDLHQDQFGWLRLRITSGSCFGIWQYDSQFFGGRSLWQTPPIRVSDAWPSLLVTLNSSTLSTILHVLAKYTVMAVLMMLTRSRSAVLFLYLGTILLDTRANKGDWWYYSVLLCDNLVIMYSCFALLQHKFNQL